MEKMVVRSEATQSSFSSSWDIKETVGIPFNNRDDAQQYQQMRVHRRRRRQSWRTGRLRAEKLINKLRWEVRGHKGAPAAYEKIGHVPLVG